MYFSKLLSLTLLAGLGAAQSIDYGAITEFNNKLQGACNQIASEVAGVSSSYQSIAGSIAQTPVSGTLNNALSEFDSNYQGLQQACAAMSQALSGVTSSYSETEGQTAANLGTPLGRRWSA
ncbi:hypothetical protein FE257_003805 [Aspergillus nanangensis]|uniref:Uncharacterized protein n=1 Tax=Aspergillus nanangensis TaxID=2582783 RepID=A0AAD4CB78_ASPNN|nr:hypothetical protein FE257_003805 [Aspergillus nanangensis]